jgi:glyoxylase-like metal-dependent hydrolase (beta-lactamase superfamily II)
MDFAQTELIRAGNPGPLTGPGTNTWIHGRGEVVVIDPGPLQPEHLERVVEVAGRMGRITALICTHHHEDHVEGARELSRLTCAPLALFHTRAQAVSDLPLHDGDTVLAGEAELTVVHTPGHASDHICLHSASDGILFTGDHVLSGTTSVIWPPDGDMDDYLTSLEKVQRLGPRRLLPGHGDPVEDPATVLEELVRHRLAREAQVLALLRRGPASPPALVPELYAEYPRAVWDAAAKTVLAHCLRLEKLGLLEQSASAAGPEFALSARSRGTATIGPSHPGNPR